MVMSKRNKQWLAGGIISVLLCMVWWVYFYSPAQARIDLAEEQYSSYLGKKMALKKKIKSLTEKQSQHMIKEGEMRDFENLLISGNNIEEVNATVQQSIQSFLRKNDITLKTYRVLRAGKWLDYDMGRLQFSIKTNNGGIASLLKYIEEMKKLVRIEKLNINYTKSRNYNLHVSFSLETLFVTE